MRTGMLFFFEPLEARRLLSVSLGSITATSAIAGTPANTVIRAEKATLTSGDISASADDRVSSVVYFADLNQDGLLDRGDTILGSSSKAAGNYAFTGLFNKKLTIGSVTIAAIAKGIHGKTDISTAATDAVTIGDDPPTIKKLTASSKVVAGTKITIIASGARDQDGSVTAVEFWIDDNHDGMIDAGDIDLGHGTPIGKSGNWKFDVDTSLAVSSTTATFVAQATDTGGAVSSPNASPSVAVAGWQVKVLSVTAVSNSAPVPLTPLTLTTTGIDPQSPVTVSFSNGAGFSFSDQPIRVGTDGAVVVAVPLYVDPASSQITSGTVSMVLTQGAVTSSPVSIDIQNLPTLDTYGTQLGGISHAMLIMDTTLLGQRLGQLQAASLVFPSIDTTAAQSTTNTLLKGAILARNDVDRVMIDNSTVIANGTLQDGASIQFDQNSLDMMDRVIGVYLTGLDAAVSNPAPSAALATQSQTQIRPAALSPADIKTLIASMEQVNGITDLAKNAQDAEKSNSVSDAAWAIAKGMNSLVGVVAGAVENEAVGLTSQAIGVVFGAVDVLRDTGEMLGDGAFILKASINGADPAALQEAKDDLANAGTKFLFDSAGTALGAASLYLKVIEDDSLAGLAIQGLQFAVSNIQFIHDSQQNQKSYETTLSVADNIAAPFSSPGQGFGQINGTVDIANAQGVASGQSSIELAGFSGASAMGIVGIADPSGNYSLFVPLGVANTDYSNLTLSVNDPISTTTLNSETVDLRGLNTTQPVQVPTLTGLVNDTDALNPDGDDPDAD